MTVPNPHVIAVVDEYSEPDLIELGKRADEVFPDGANVSFLLPLDAGTTTSTSAPVTASSASADPRCSSAPSSAARA